MRDTYSPFSSPLDLGPKGASFSFSGPYLGGAMGATALGPAVFKGPQFWEVIFRYMQFVKSTMLQQKYLLLTIYYC